MSPTAAIAAPRVRLELVNGQQYRVVTSNSRVHMAARWDRDAMAFTLPGQHQQVVSIGLDYVERVAPMSADRRGNPQVDWDREADIDDCYLERLSAPGQAGGIHG